MSERQTGQDGAITGEPAGRQHDISAGGFAVPGVAEAESGGELLIVRGLVQGVGFRPAVWRLARDCGLAGDVRNDAGGVSIRIWGDAAARSRFASLLQKEAPPLARIDALERIALVEPAPDGGFHITASDGGPVQTGVAMDAATCPDCLAEVFDSSDRRYRYAFTNCTHCGPRLSIVRAIPYDRAHTSMAGFTMCAACRREYEDPADRRFHAQPNACPDCGPRLWLETAESPGVEVEGDPIESTQARLRDGYIVAIKGIGGIHLACDATNSGAVDRLRHRKHRFDKPFALMAGDFDMVRRFCSVDDAERELLGSTAAPIVLLEADGVEALPPAVAPGQHCHGFMLPYSPLHHLLMAGLDAPIVLTSGNRSDEPQCIDNAEARQRLGDIADALLLHDRDIVNRLDDSVVRVIAGTPTVLRRARGSAPEPLPLPEGFRAAPPSLALGGELKNTFCQLRDGQAVLSQHLGDLGNAAAHGAYHETLGLFHELFEHRPRMLAVDAHPEYLSTKLGVQWSESAGIGITSVQHHHAHIAACMVDNGLDIDAPPVLGIALDGLGYGEDGTLWGGEWLLADYQGFTRLASLAPVAMPGGVKAIQEPWRMAWAHLTRCADWQRLASQYADLPFFTKLSGKPLDTLQRMMETGLNCPLTTSCGRLFDAVAALADLRSATSYEGQAAMELEAAVDTAALRDGCGYTFSITDMDGRSLLDPLPMWEALLADLREGVSVGIVAARFHAGLAMAIERTIEHLSRRHGDTWGGRVALSGGVFQNAVLSECLVARLEARGLEVLRHGRVPANDGGLSLGQAAVAAVRSSGSHSLSPGRGVG